MNANTANVANSEVAPPLHIALVLTPQCVVSGVLGVMDMLSTANYVARKFPGVDVRFLPTLVSADGKPVETMNGVSMPAQSALPDPSSLAIAFVPSGPPANFGVTRMRQTLAGQQPLIDWLRAVHEAGGLLASCCTGSFLLAATGLLDGRLATTHWRGEEAFRALFPRVELRIDSLLVEGERLLCGGGAQSFSSTVLRLISQLQGEAVAAQTARLMLADGHTSGQNAYRLWVPRRDHGDEAIAMGQQWLEAHYREAFDMDGLAAQLRLTPRTLMRRFRLATGMTPLQYQQRLRIEEAKTQLEASRTSVNQVVWQTGYEDASSFQRLFKRETGLTMAEYRQRFGQRRWRADGGGGADALFAGPV
ncbi:GlxA family transcriptional regulator [Hylemonella gracilis]|uniref:Transcriptional regulator n=1 Tax=Hylemonella gracilis ATCC 19624 TaxID=887062 RepID=F3KWD2_9BURK|nr:helix-turn-helix domain-containing protein [Hylemonella gracilis]EGI75931.1 transcriptional regulator [Hylemonella gracilis ATCC 19624]